ncbi:MAG: hypothetical protein FWD27_06315 [Coriobacteriia bacterium]|nr:hypothetical protein [Coriobacteriia bacterium]
MSSGYKPKRSRASDEPFESRLFSSTSSLQKHDEAEDLATEGHDETQEAFHHDDEFLDSILEADQAVRAHPELAHPELVAQTQPQAAEDPEIAAIRKRRWPITIAIILVAIVAGGAIAFYVLSSQALERETNRTAGYVHLDEAIALIQESDQVVVSLDTMVAAEVTQDSIPERKILLERVSGTLETLKTAQEEALLALALMSAQDDRELAQHVIDAAINRQDMLTSGEIIVTKDIEAMNSALFFGQAWETIVNADTELRATTELSRTGGYYQLHEAIERNQAILENLNNASALLIEAEEAFLEADYSTMRTYLTLKVESIQMALEADQAVLDGDLELVNAKNEEFALKDAEVVTAAALIPPEPLSLILDAYDETTKEARALYDSARANAVEADRFIREYVGVETQTGVQ